MTRKNGYKTILLLAILSIFLLVMPMAQAGWFSDLQNKLKIGTPEYQCNIEINSEIEECKVNSRTHICQLYSKYSGDEDDCDFCIERSEFLDTYEKECIKVLVTTSHLKDGEKNEKKLEEKTLNNNSENISETNNYLNDAKEKFNTTKNKIDEIKEGIDENVALVKDAIDEVENTINSLTGEEDFIVPKDIENLKPGESKQIEYYDEKYSVLIAQNGAILYTIDGTHYYPTKEDAMNPGIFKKMGTGFDWFKGLVFNRRKGEEKLMNSVGVQMVDEIRNSEQVKTIIQQGNNSLAVQGISSVIGPAAYGISISTTSIVLLDEEITRDAFVEDIINYITLREENGTSKNSIKNDDSFKTQTSKNSLFNSKNDEFDAYENAYYRYCVKLKLEEK